MRTDSVVKQEGINALIAQLGYVDAERFIALMNSESFDYTKWREKLQDKELSVRELSRKANVGGLE